VCADTYVDISVNYLENLNLNVTKRILAAKISRRILELLFHTDFLFVRSLIIISFCSKFLNCASREAIHRCDKLNLKKMADVRMQGRKCVREGIGEKFKPIRESQALILKIEM